MAHIESIKTHLKQVEFIKTKVGCQGKNRINSNEESGGGPERTAYLPDKTQ